MLARWDGSNVLIDNVDFLDHLADHDRAHGTLCVGGVIGEQVRYGHRQACAWAFCAAAPLPL